MSETKEEHEPFGHQNLKAGDIVVWSTKPGCPFEKSIALLSGDEITHAALVSRDAGVVIEQVPGGTRTNTHPWNRQGRTVYVIRRESLGNMDPVLKIAEASLEAKDPLGYTDLLVLCILLIFRNPHLLFTDTKIVVDGFKAFFAGAKLKAVEETENSAFCSQFVFDCYKEAGPEYALEIDRVLGRIDDQAVEKLFQSIVSHLPDATTQEASGEHKQKRPKTSTSEEKDNDSMLEIFQKSIEIATKEHKEETKKPSAATAKEIDPELATTILDFAFASAKQSGESADPDPARTPLELALDALRNLKNRANLVTPGDLTRITNDDAKIIGTFEN